MGASAPAKKKKKGISKAAKPSRAPLSKRLGDWGKTKRHEFVEVVQSLNSEDAPTRRMAMVFVAALVGMVGVTALTVERYWAYHERNVTIAEAKHRREKDALTKMLERQAEVARMKNSMLPLGTFSVEIKSRAPAARETSAHDVSNTAEIEIVIECDTRDTRVFIEDNFVQARNQVTDALTDLDRETLMSVTGKNRLKRLIIQHLNSILPRGKVQNLYFSKLLLG